MILTDDFVGTGAQCDHAWNRNPFTDVQKSLKDIVKEGGHREIYLVMEYMEANKRNPIPDHGSPTRCLSKHRIEEHDMLSWIKQQRKLIKAGSLKSNRMAKFLELEKLFEDNKRLNQYV